MIEPLLVLLNEKRNSLIEERDKFNYDAESREIETHNTRLNDAIQRRDSKKTIFEGYQKEAEIIEDIIEKIQEIIQEDEEEEEEDD